AAAARGVQGGGAGAPDAGAAHSSPRPAAPGLAPEEIQPAQLLHERRTERAARLEAPLEHGLVDEAALVHEAQDRGLRLDADDDARKIGAPIPDGGVAEPDEARRQDAAHAEAVAPELELQAGDVAA